MVGFAHTSTVLGCDDLLQHDSARKSRDAAQWSQLALLETQAAALIEEVSSACAKVDNLGAAIAVLL